MGARAYRYLSLYQPAAGCLIEIGSERGEGSTAFLAAYATQHRLEFHTTDVDPEAYEQARQITPNAHLGTGVALLKSLKEPVSVAYLDGFDWIPEGAEQEAWIQDQRARYRTLGHELDNDACQAVHLEEARELAERARHKCAVICDDTWLENDRWDGKGGQAVPYLTGRGFRVVDHGPREDKSLGYVVMRRG